MTLTFDILTLKVVSESGVTRATSVTILVFLEYDQAGDLIFSQRGASQTHRPPLEISRNTGIRQLVASSTIFSQPPIYAKENDAHLQACNQLFYWGWSRPSFPFSPLFLSIFPSSLPFPTILFPSLPLLSLSLPQKSS